MAVVNQVDKKVRVDKYDVVKYQLVTHCFLSYTHLSDAELNCLTYLAINGEQELNALCNIIYDKKIFSSPQSARNCIAKLEKKGMIVKEGKNKKKITINPVLNIHSQGNVLLNYKFLSVES
jgi:predicted transcriptional regulator